MIRNDIGQTLLRAGSPRAAAERMPAPRPPRDHWDRPGGDWGLLVGPDALERREHANSCYRMGSKALRRGDGRPAVTWLKNACMELHPGAAFRLAVALWREAYDRGRSAAVREEVLGVLEAAARFGHGDARILLDFHARSQLSLAQRSQAAAWQDPDYVPAVAQILASYPPPAPARPQQAAPAAPAASQRYSPHALRAAKVASTSQQMNAPLGRQRWESAMRVLDVLDVIASAGRPVDSERIRTRTSLPHRVLEQLLFWLCGQGLIERLPDASYIAGPLLKMMSAEGESLGPQVILHRALGRLRDTVAAAVYLASYDQGEVSITHCADGPSAPRVQEWVDFRDAAHASAVGKSLLHQLDFDSRMEHLSRRKAVRLTPRTITDSSALFRSIDHHGPQAVQFDLFEYSGQYVCVAVPLGIGGQAGCVALSLPLAQRHRLLEIARVLSDQATGLLLSLLLASAPPLVEPGRQGHPGMSATTGTDPHGSGTTPPATTTAPDHGLVPNPAGDPGRLWLPATARPTTEPPSETDDHSDDHEQEQPRQNGIQFGRRSLTACLNELSARRTRHLTHSSA
ncbi:IclR family transcriptional regulator C-terminal domain-containing protein [Streptomyces sp. MB09-01]|uniref:IclR family transcriptional regulator domain-containing protein n=1 Tax=Streptomyces sp. MB09-01 TaxID=3028666 RepID=UPI0029A533BF|nr:IclR family transcriptional regulator C-terminal domain-containing protein [Streptomyces sp. MB09-01]MDX3540118.1 IclR family transcriptional regulator C-terminal domain-containing protein [Streptomyces sp. MB09-01]